LKTVGHHACKQTGGYSSVLENSPFYAEHNPGNNKYQFLGSGYYFWDNNLELAKSWGKSRCNNDYYVVEIDFELTSENCFDLVGNRNHQIYLLKMLDILKKETGHDKNKTWTLNQCVEFLRKLNRENDNVFPYKLIRAIDLHNHTVKAQRSIKFIENKENYTIINPKLVIFAFEKEDLNLPTKRIVVSS